MMPPAPPSTPLSVYVLTLAVALGACAVAASVMVPDVLGNTATAVLIAGVVVLIGALAGLWSIERRRDRFSR